MITKYFGDIPVEEESLIFFPDGLPGFESVKRYALLPFFDGDESMLCLQAADSLDPAFVVINPFSVDPDYQPRLTDEDLVVLKSNKDTALAFYIVTVVAEDFRDSTVNLRCPLAVNPAVRLGKQVVMEDSNYSMHTPLCDGCDGQREGE